jgi:superfamily I DNA and/or RNA helicase
MNPEVYSKFACEKGLQKSLPKRLFDHYGKSKDPVFKEEHVMFLHENYRSNKEILEFPSHHFYRGKIVAKGHENNPSHPELGPLIFYTAKGQDEKQDDNTYLNAIEVDEIVKRVAELIEKWPKCWGEKSLQDIAVIAPYRYQVS